MRGTAYFAHISATHLATQTGFRKGPHDPERVVKDGMESNPIPKAVSKKHHTKLLVCTCDDFLPDLWDAREENY
jgi:hypothetical protein